MFRIVSVEIEGFKTFSTKQTFTLPTKAGLYFVTGEHKTRPRMGANGVGKSTLIDAIFWCLYGRTPRGLKAGDIITWGQKHARVQVALNINNIETIVTRTQAPNSLELTQDGKGRPVDQEAVDKAVRLNAEAFEVSVIRPQFGESFLKLKPAEKLTLFSDIMGLNYWLEKAQAATELARDLRDEEEKCERDFSNLNGQILILDDDIAELEGKEADFEADRKLQSEQQMGMLAQQIERRDELKKYQTKLESGFEELNADYAAFEGRLEKLTSKLTELGGTIGKIEGGQHAIVSERRKAQDFLARLPEAGATCPHCQQAMSKAHLKAEQTRLNGEVKQCNRRVDALSTQLDGLNKEKQTIFKKIANLKDDRIEVGGMRTELASKISKTTTDLRNAESAIEGFKSAARVSEAKENPYTEMIAAKRKTLRKQKNQRNELREEIKKISEQSVGVNYWVTGFKKIRLFIIEQTLKQLEIEINNNLASLGMPEWAITLDVERENKSGGVTKGFVVFVQSPDSKQPVRFEAWSGGETQRLCLAGDMGLANLILERAGLINEVEFYDEPSKGLSTEGLYDLAETLAQRAANENKVIFLIDHCVIDFGGFAGHVRVIKDSEGSSLTVES